MAQGENNELQMAAMATLDGSLVPDADFVPIAKSRLVARLPQFGQR